MAKTPVQDRSRERVSRMLSSFAELLDEVGYDSVSTTMVARRSGSAVGSLYQFFGNKDELADALRDRLADALTRATQANLEAYLPQAEASGEAVGLENCFTALHYAMESVHRHEAGARHLSVDAARMARRLAQMFRPYCTRDEDLLYSYVLVAVASSEACCKAAFADRAHGLDVLGLCQWSLHELGRNA